MCASEIYFGERQSMKSVLKLCSFILFLSLSFFAHADVIVIDINETSNNKLPLAVPHFINAKGGSAGAQGAKMQELLIKDFKLSGLFDVWNDERLPRNDYNLVDIDFAQWKAFEVHALIKGVITQEGGQDVAQLRLYDVASGKMLVGKQYIVDGDKYIDAVHRFVDSSMKALTGVRGPFESKIVASCGKTNKEDIFVYEMDDARRSRVTKTAQNNTSPSWSFDGKRIAYSGRLKNGELHIFTAGEGGGATQVTNYKNFSGVNTTPTWTADGNLVFSSARTDDSELYLVSPSGRILSQITKSYNGDLSASVNANGEMVFVSERAGQVHIFKGSLAGGGAVRMTFVGSHNEQPDWSPDGSKIVFSSGGGIRQDIFVMESDGSNIVRLTEGEGGNSSPTWSPDGRYISFDSTRGGLFIMRDDGTNQTMIEKTAGCKNADWGPWLSQE